MIFNMSGGGGAALNFKVMGGTAEPSNPAENTIWIDTDAKITGWLFSSHQPENPAEGMVWIATGSASNAEFNALKKNNITVYPLSAKQLINGAWVDKEAKSYQDGAWVDWLTYLFRETAGQVVPFTSTKETNGSVTIGTRSIVLNYSSETNGQVVLRTTNTVDLTKAKKLVFDAVCTKTQDNDFTLATFLVNSSVPTAGVRYNSFAAYAVMQADNVRRQYAIDINGFTGQYYVGAKGLIGGTIYNIWLE